MQNEVSGEPGGVFLSPQNVVAYEPMARIAGIKATLITIK